MPKKKTPELDPKEQFKRFQETAKTLEVDESGDAFAKAFGSIAKSQAKSRKAVRKDGA